MARVAALALACSAFGPLRAGDFGVSPIRVDLDRSTRTTVVKVSNEESQPLSFQLRLMEWTQDADGRDVYSDSSDLVYFPQQFQVPPKDSRVVRIGYRNPATQAERAYRLYVEELPRRGDASDAGKAVIDVAVRFGIPVFLRPPAIQEKGDVALSMDNGKVAASVENHGSVHFRINRVAFAGYSAGGEKVFEQTLDGWYLLAGARRAYSAPFPREACMKAARLRVEVVAEKLNLRREVEVRPEHCS